ncbi:DMT family transporter [Amycolatopsis australiensis]|uniref:Permease of the drug/metabolite transporter (DMT) superfamily n=1 Tax=Amycolatopsis australiensis TaxID=546364 RepID=A0A1K1RSP7_9PSEU|nr:DMT family transporter [Amycolatopsis australiensis]SFW75315.1 Permease of the drug/metabolite transporter (DMT) superfamily [Amycolatopsis australiensis]
MKLDSSATHFSQPPLLGGLGWGLAGVVAFSLTVPFTRLAVGSGQMSPLFVGCGRAVVAALLAAAALGFTRQPRPRGRQWWRVAVVAGGVVAGFPLLTSFALTSAPAAHGAVVIALLPAATAVLAVLRGRERPPAAFWVTAALGAVAVVIFAALPGGLGGLHVSDLLLAGAVLAAAIGYAEGGLLARELGAWQTVSWALVLAGPPMTVLTAVAAVRTPPGGAAAAWAAFAYLAVVSMFLGFFAWYRGLAIGPMARVSQVQLVQPVLTITWAALLLDERLTWPTIAGGAAVIACAGLAVRTRRGGGRAGKTRAPGKPE